MGESKEGIRGGARATVAQHIPAFKAIAKLSRIPSEFWERIGTVYGNRPVQYGLWS